MALGKWMMTEPKTVNGLVSDNALGTLFERSPQKASNIMHRLLFVNRGMSLERQLNMFPTKYFESDDDFTWDLIGSSRRNIALIQAEWQGAVVTAATNRVGQGGDLIKLTFGENYFFDGYTIVGERNEMYPLRIIEDLGPEGSNHAYMVQLMGSNRQNGIPGEELIAGKRFSEDYALVEREMSRKVGDIRFSTPFKMRNEFSTIRLQHKVAGNKLGRKLICGIPVITKENTKRVDTMWMHHVDFQFEEQFAKDKSHALMYGVSNRDVDGEYYDFGKSGNVIKSSAGIREQMSYGNITYYNNFDIKMIENALVELSIGKLGPSERKFMMRTGEWGAIQFHKAVLNHVSGWRAFNYLRAEAPAIITSTSSDLHSNSLSAGFQFTKYLGPNNVEITIEVDPFYDDPIRNKIPHPDGGVTESYRYDILYIGSTEEPNIQLCKIRGQEELKGYQWGPFQNPFTNQQNNSSASSDEDMAVIHKKASLGAIIFNPERTKSFIYNSY